MAAAGSRSSEAEGDLFLSEVRIRRKDSEEDHRILCPSQGATAEKKSSDSCSVSAETQDYVSAPPLTSCMEQEMTAEDEKDMERSFLPSAVNSWLLDDVEDKAADRGKNQEAKEDESISLKREVKQKWLLQKWRARVEQRSCHGQLLE